MRSAENLRIAREFIGLITGDPLTPMTFQTFDDKKENKDRSLTRILHGTIDDKFDELSALSEKGAGIFFVPNITDLKGRKLENIVGVRTVYIDCDDGPVESYEIEPNLFVPTARGGHSYWVLSKQVSADEFNRIAKALISFYESDPAIKQANLEATIFL